MSPNKSNAPCLNCEDRQENCHSKCEVYIAWAGKRKIANAKRLEGNDARSYEATKYLKMLKARERKKLK